MIGSGLSFVRPGEGRIVMRSSVEVGTGGYVVRAVGVGGSLFWRIVRGVFGVR